MPVGPNKFEELNNLSLSLSLGVRVKDLETILTVFVHILFSTHTHRKSPRVARVCESQECVVASIYKCIYIIISRVRPKIYRQLPVCEPGVRNNREIT